jgi:hypothetical protein
MIATAKLTRTLGAQQEFLYFSVNPKKRKCAGLGIVLICLGEHNGARVIATKAMTQTSPCSIRTRLSHVIKNNSHIAYTNRNSHIKVPHINASTVVVNKLTSDREE